VKKAAYLERERRKAEIKARPRRLPSREYMTVTVNPRPEIRDDFFALMAAFPPKVQRDFWNPAGKSARRNRP